MLGMETENKNAPAICEDTQSNGLGKQVTASAQLHESVSLSGLRLKALQVGIICSVMFIGG